MQGSRKKRVGLAHRRFTGMRTIAHRSCVHKSRNYETMGGGELCFLNCPEGVQGLWHSLCSIRFSFHSVERRRTTLLKVRIDDPGLASRSVKLYRGETKGVS